MYDLIAKFQLELLTILGGTCGFITLILLAMKMSSRKKKYAFILISFWTMVLLFSDRLVYAYRVDERTVGIGIVHLCNFLIFAAILFCELGINGYIFAVLDEKVFDKQNTKLLRIGRALVFGGLGMLVIFQFAGILARYDASNRYQSAPIYVVCYLFPTTITVLQLLFMVKNKDGFRRRIFDSIVLFLLIPCAAAVIQIFCPGISVSTLSVALAVILLYFFALSDQNMVLTELSQSELDTMRHAQEEAEELLRQTIEALASAIDAADRYTLGHSTRVADYSKEIAKIAGLSQEECEKVYFSALLHDVGKIGISDTILNKTGRLTDEEFAIIKQHPSIGAGILSQITKSPYLKLGANYHHERYDGKGYPEGLRGDDIPNIARIIAVADSYDAMTSKRSYRDQIAQQRVREEIVKGMHTQFDPTYAWIMLRLIDLDSEYQMREIIVNSKFGDREMLLLEEYESDYSTAIRVTENPSIVSFRYKSTILSPQSVPSIIIFDALDSKYHSLQERRNEMEFEEFARINFDGTILRGNVRKIERTVIKGTAAPASVDEFVEVCMEIVKVADHVRLKIKAGDYEDETLIALTDKSHYVYLAITGEHIVADHPYFEVLDDAMQEGDIPRIVDDITYTDEPVGMIPNVQIDGWCSAHSEPMKLFDGMTLLFHSVSLPSSRRVWHTPVVRIFTSDDGKVLGPNYAVVSHMCCDGESWSSVETYKNTPLLIQGEDFGNWDQWKQRNREGTDCRVTFHFESDQIIVRIYNSGLIFENRVTNIHPAEEELFVSVTGDQCAITNIRTADEI